jgi:hypothetical protein
LVVAFDVELLARSNPDDTAILSQCLADRKNTTIIYTSETRSVGGVEISEKVLHLPAADAIVADGGGSVHSRVENPGIADLDKLLASKWIGADVVKDRLCDLGRLVGEHNYESSRRYSCFPLYDVSLGEAMAAVKRALSDLAVDITASEVDRIDISTQGINTRWTLVQVLDLLETEPRRAVVSGQFVDEELIASGGCWGIVTGEIKHTTKATIVHYPRVHLTAAEGSAGILEGLEMFGFV